MMERHKMEIANEPLKKKMQFTISLRTAQTKGNGEEWVFDKQGFSVWCWISQWNVHVERNAQDVLGKDQEPITKQACAGIG